MISALLLFFSILPALPQISTIRVIWIEILAITVTDIQPLELSSF